MSLACLLQGIRGVPFIGKAARDCPGVRGNDYGDQAMLLYLDTVPRLG